MTLPGFTAEATLYDATAYHIRHGTPSEAVQPLVRLAAYIRMSPSESPTVRYACHQLCDGDNVCIIVCGPIDYI